MSKQREALEKALLALEIAPLDHNSVKSSFFEKRHYAIIALREALDETEQEPVAWPHKLGCRANAFGKCDMGCTAPPTRKPLTDEDITAIVQSMSAYTWDVYMLARAIERAHGIGD